MSTANGLSAREERILTTRLAQMEALYSKRAYMGNQESEPIRRLAESIRVRLNPPMPADLDAEAQKHLDLYRDCHWFEFTMKDIAA
jgi:hypothetical protein